MARLVAGPSTGSRSRTGSTTLSIGCRKLTAAEDWTRSAMVYGRAASAKSHPMVGVGVGAEIAASPRLAGQPKMPRPDSMPVLFNNSRYFGQSNRDSKIRVIFDKYHRRTLRRPVLLPAGAGSNRTIYPPMRKDRSSPPTGGGRSMSGVAPPSFGDPLRGGHVQPNRTCHPSVRRAA